MNDWKRVPEDEIPLYGRTFFQFSTGSSFYDISIDRSHPFDLFVKYRSDTWTWQIEKIFRLDKKFRISGIAFAEEPVLSDTAWFELWIDENPKIDYWGNQILLRTDYLV